MQKQRGIDLGISVFNSLEKMKKQLPVGSIFWLAIGIYVAIVAYRLDLGELSEPGPGLIFFLAAWVLIIFSCLDIWASARKREKESLWSETQWKRVLLVLAALAAYILFFKLLGFILCTFLLMLFLFKSVEPTRWRAALWSSGIVFLASYGVFKIWLKVPFPEGILGW